MYSAKQIIVRVAMSERQRERTEMITIHKILFIVFSFSVICKYYMGKTPTVIIVKDPKFSVLSPSSAQKILLNDDYRQLIDLQNFSFIHNPQPCKNYSAGLLLMVIVSSNPNNSKHRETIRSTWGRNYDSTKVVFLIGESENITVSNQINKEIMKHGDIIQGNFVDAYRNMTYKHVMGLKWVAHHCAVAKYVLKTDDDVLVNSRGLRHFLARELSPWGSNDLIMCQVLEHALAQRSNKSKWKVTTDEYHQKYYPTYCAGWAILYSQDVVHRLLTAVQSLPYFWIDDVHITGICAEKIGVPRTVLSTLMLTQLRVEILKILGPKYAGPFLFGPPDVNSATIKDIWKAIPA